MPYFIGIDPGVSGAFAILSEPGDIVDLGDLPVKNSKRNRKILSSSEFADILVKYSDEVVMTGIEDVWANPTLGAASSFSFGHMAGSLQTCFSLLEIPFTLVVPSTWKKSFKLIKAQKSASVDRALEIYPRLRFKRKKDHNRADALLIAHYIWLRN